jgi:cytochrome c-type biogenesis protein CcmE
MTDMAWEKTKNTEKLKNGKNERWKFMLAGLLILGAIAYLVFTSTVNGARFFITVDEVLANSDYQGQSWAIASIMIRKQVLWNLRL